MKRTDIEGRDVEVRLNTMRGSTHHGDVVEQLAHVEL
jgi:hypothetical protein